MDYTIRPVRLEDAEGLSLLRRTPGVFENTLALPSERIQRNTDRFHSLGPNDHQFVAALADGTIIGNAHLQVGAAHRIRHVGTVGISVRTDWQNRGVGTALLKTLLDLADNWLMLVRVELLVYADNERAIRLYEKLGFEIEARLRSNSVRGGRYLDDYLMSRLKRPELPG